MSVPANQQMPESQAEIAWPSYLGYTAYVAAVRANFRDYDFSVSKSVVVGNDRQFTVIEKSKGRYRYVVVLSDRRGVVKLRAHNGYAEQTISLAELFRGNVSARLWPELANSFLDRAGYGG